MKRIQKIALVLIISLAFIPNVMAASKYTIKFDANGGKGTTEKVTCKVNKKCKLTKNGFSKEGYTFNGWNTKKNGSGKTYKNKSNVKDLAKKGTVKLYATWKANKYTIKFNGNGATETSYKISIVYDKKIAIPKNTFTRKGYMFDSWNTKKDGSGTKYKDKSKVKNLAKKGTVTLYAQWKETVTISFSTDGNGHHELIPAPIPSQTVLKGSKVIKPKNPIIEGYHFVEWQLEGEPYDFNQKVTKDILLTANWDNLEWMGCSADYTNKYSIFPSKYSVYYTNGKYNYNISCWAHKFSYPVYIEFYKSDNIFYRSLPLNGTELNTVFSFNKGENLELNYRLCTDINGYKECSEQMYNRLYIETPNETLDEIDLSNIDYSLRFYENGVEIPSLPVEITESLTKYDIDLYLNNTDDVNVYYWYKKYDYNNSSERIFINVDNQHRIRLSSSQKSSYFGSGLTLCGARKLSNYKTYYGENLDHCVLLKKS